MKPDQNDRLEARGDLGKPGEFLLGTLQLPEIVGEVAKPVLEAIRRLWWRGFDRRAREAVDRLSSRSSESSLVCCSMA
jgi:hypothetical protein